MEDKGSFCPSSFSYYNFFKDLLEPKQTFPLRWGPWGALREGVATTNLCLGCSEPLAAPQNFSCIFFLISPRWKAWGLPALRWCHWHPQLSLSNYSHSAGLWYGSEGCLWLSRSAFVPPKLFSSLGNEKRWKMTTPSREWGNTYKLLTFKKPLILQPKERDIRMTRAELQALQ